MRVSLRHIAEKAGVSRVTASNVVRGRHAQMSVETRERVRAAMRELNYVPVPPPSLQNRHVDTRIIGVVFDEVEIEDMWGMPTFRGMRAAAREAGYDLLTLLRTPDRWFPDRGELRYLDRRTDGYVFVVPNDGSAAIEALARHKIPVATCFTGNPRPGVATIALDNAGAMRQAVELMVGFGHRRILFLGEGETRIDFRNRRLGYEAAMLAAGLSPDVFSRDGLCDAAGRRLLKPRLKRGGFDAIVAASDDIAIQAIELAREMGISIPGELSIAGMDDIPRTAEFDLTTFRFSSEEVGRNAIRAIVNMLQGGVPEEQSRVVEVELVRRGSVAAFEPNHKFAGRI